MDLLEFEHKREPLAPRARLFWRLGRNAMFAFGVIVIALAVGMSGYMGFEGMGFVDGFLNAAMILSGMGPVNELKTVAGKVFAGLYAIASGLLLFRRCRNPARPRLSAHDPSLSPRGGWGSFGFAKKMFGTNVCGLRS